MKDHDHVLLRAVRSLDRPRRAMPYFRAGATLAIGLAIGATTMTAHAFTAADADTLFEAHSNAFYRVDGDLGWYKETTHGGTLSFWMRAEQLEMVLDTFERTHNPAHLEMFARLFRGFVADHGADWSRNEFNDDIMWMVIACTRGYLLSGRSEFLVAARSNFDACFARAFSKDLGGGMWWKTDNRSKNACVNSPGAIAAALLARARKEPAYEAKARDLFLWMHNTLFDPQTGRVFDNVRRSGRISHAVFSYNLGTFVGAAHLLGYPEEARLAATFAMNALGVDGILPDTGEHGDGGGFNGICARWIARYMYERGLEDTFEPWLRKNADAAWQVRRHSDNLSWPKWNEPTPPGERHSWGCSSSVVILQVVHPEPTKEPPISNDTD